MAELYSYFLFNPLGSSRAPPLPIPPRSLIFRIPDPDPGREQPLGDGLSTKGCFSAEGPPKRWLWVSPLAPERSPTPRNSFERASEIGRDPVRRDALALCYAPGRNREARRSGWGQPSSPLLPSGWKTPSFSSLFPSQRAMPFLKIIFFKPEEGGVAQGAAPGTSPHLRSRLGWFSGNRGFYNIPNPMWQGEAEKRKTSLGWAAAPLHFTTGRGVTMGGGKIRDFFTSAEFVKGNFPTAAAPAAKTLETDAVPRSPGSNAPQSGNGASLETRCRGASAGTSPRAPGGPRRGRGAKPPPSPRVGPRSPPPRGSFRAGK